MKSFKSILIAFCCTALLSQVASGAEHHNKVPKSETVFTVDQYSVTSFEYVAISQTFVFPAPTEIAMNGSFYAADLPVNRIAWMPPEKFHSHGSFCFSIAILPECIVSPHGDVTYLKQLKPFYSSPNVDDKWKWQFSQMYNC
jgi:hypothetical protein